MQGLFHLLPLVLPLLLPSAAPTSPDTTLRVRAVGDIMLGSDFPEGFLPPDDGVGSLLAVMRLLEDADLTFANLEGPLCDGGQTEKCNPNKPPGSCYAFRSPTRYGQYLKEAGIDVVSTANNHAVDFGEDCRAETERTLDALGIAHSGRPGDVASLELRGLKVGLIAFHVKETGHWLNDHESAARLVRELDATHDLVLVSFHGGAEGRNALHVVDGPELYLEENRGDLKAFARAVIDAGADLVIGHGPHVLRGLEIYRDRLVMYSLGNFATYGRFNLSSTLGIGAVIEASLDREGRFLGGQIHPTRQVGKGTVERDPERKGVELIRLLTSEDFPQSGPVLRADGAILPR
jgi:poly-gamma-glutamate capsule biosynthesis protein CapA/YwtB (metallophosphatase superfamily)